ncbi:hypothetical protein AMTRI_Chr09g20570 [Amborella trichopoda]
MVFPTSINNDSVLQAYTATKVQRVPTKASSTLCHNMPYPYAVYYCHYIGEGRIYKVKLEGEDGTWWMRLWGVILTLRIGNHFQPGIKPSPQVKRRINTIMLANSYLIPTSFGLLFNSP